MKFSVKQYFNLNNNATNEDILQLFMNELDNNHQQIIDLINECANNQSFVYPNSNINTYQKMKDIILLSLLINGSLTSNPMLYIQAEAIFQCQKMLTLDVFIFFIKIFHLSLKETDTFKLDSFEKIINAYNSHLNKKYFYSPYDLLKTNILDINLDINNIENKSESEFK